MMAGLNLVDNYLDQAKTQKASSLFDSIKVFVGKIEAPTSKIYLV